jgi:taurine dioxygenase/putative 2-oxoglutarate oxygenase
MSNTSVAGAPRRASSSPSFASRPLTEHFGVEVVGFDFSKNLDAESVAQIRDLADTHFVVLFRGQPLSEEQHVAFTAALGEPVLPVESAFSSIKNPTILRLGNVDHDGKHLDADAPMTRYFVSAEKWHSDGSFKQVPNYLTMLHSLEIPPEGGETWFASMVAALAALPDETKALLRGKQMEHPYVHGNSKIKDWKGKALPKAVHPVIRTLPDGREALFLSSYEGGRILGMAQQESDRMVAELFEFATQPKFVYKHQWRLSDTLIWNNRGVIHQAQYYDRKYRRLLQRTEIGDRQRGAPDTRAL